MFSDSVFCFSFLDRENMESEFPLPNWHMSSLRNLT